MVRLDLHQCSNSNGPVPTVTDKRAGHTKPEARALCLASESVAGNSGLNSNQSMKLGSRSAKHRYLLMTTARERGLRRRTDFSPQRQSAMMAFASLPLTGYDCVAITPKSSVFLTGAYYSNASAARGCLIHGAFCNSRTRQSQSRAMARKPNDKPTRGLDLGDMMQEILAAVRLLYRLTLTKARKLAYVQFPDHRYESPRKLNTCLTVLLKDRASQPTNSRVLKSVIYFSRTHANEEMYFSYFWLSRGPTPKHLQVQTCDTPQM